MSEQIHFFASHSWDHNHRREGLHAILSPWMRGLDFQDYSISRQHPLNTDTDPQLASELRDIIKGMDALLIMAGMYANNSPWMQFEIHMAYAFGVPIIPILSNGQERVPRLPTRLATCPPVRWRGGSIREALLSCVSEDRRAMIEFQVACRVEAEAADKASRRRGEIARGLRAANPFGAGALSPPRDPLGEIYGLPRRRTLLEGALTPETDWLKDWLADPSRLRRRP